MKFNLAPEISTRSRKRILSDMVSKSDLAEESSKAKKGRSGEVTPPTVAEESENLVMKDQSQGPISPDKSLSSSSEEDIYMVTDEGVKKKLPTIEKRWVTRQEFRSLAKNKMLLNTDQTWGNGSATSSETIDSSASANHSSSRTPLKQRASLEFEQGSIWNLQGKPSSRLVSPGSAVSNKMRSASRPRNSLGRLRLSFQQETPPTSNSRSYRLSLLGDDRYLDGKDSPTKTDVADKDLVASGERNSSKLAEKDSDISNPIVSPSPNEILQNPTVNDSSISTSDADVALQKKPNPPLFSNLQSTNQESLFKAGEIEPAKSDAVPTFNFGETKAGVNLPKNISGKPLKGENFKMGSDSLASPFSFSTGSSFASGSSGLYKQTPFSLATPTTSKQDSKALTIGSSTTIFGSQSFQPTQPLGNIFNTNTNSQVTSAGAPKPVLALSSGNESVNSSTPISSGIKSNLKTSNLFASPSFKTTAPSSNIFSSSSASFAFGESNSAQISEAVKNDAASAFKAPQASPASIFKPGGLGKTFGSTENSGFVSAQSEKSQSGAEKSLPSFSNSKQDSKGPEMTFNFQGTNLFSKNGGNTQNSQNESISSSSSPKPIGSTFPSNQSSQSDGAAAQQNSDTGSRSVRFS
ncbi:hypothetical protein BY996DRAFT_1014692 [Phakopsora pachyrhizi]|uniref:Expressed protein n=1 Tax=Phakopsora pachyrhizi TaxID=170000 RepID=A0AAV0B011_PHAPC|nr:hypothetical protein BY996DRAFT_1014692 [Phakopsora pachyrhizi]CAH7675377.1 expressed protein [Phakopsora pachyrhizi]